MAMRKDAIPAVSGLSPALAVADGGTGDTTAGGARKNLGFEDLGFGVRAIPVVSTLNWQTLDIISGQIVRVSSSNMSNVPAAAGSFGTGVITYFRRMGDSSDARQIWEIWNDPTDNSFSRRLQVIVVGAAGARTFIVRNIYTSADIISLANGGTGASTAAGALAALGAIGTTEVSDYIRGFDITVNAAGIVMSPGSARLPDGSLLSTVGNFNYTFPALAASTWYYLYLYSITGGVAVEISTTVPIAYAYPAQQKTGDASRRFLGCVRSDSSGSPIPCFISGGNVRYTNAWYSVNRVLAGGRSTSATAVAVSGLVPPFVSTGVSATWNNGDSSGTCAVGSNNGAMMFNIVPGGKWESTIPVPGYPNIYYQYLSASASAGLFIDIGGYTYAR